MHSKAGELLLLETVYVGDRKNDYVFNRIDEHSKLRSFVPVGPDAERLAFASDVRSCGAVRRQLAVPKGP